MNENTYTDIKNILLSGLLTDGAHHKQYYLDYLAKTLLTDIDYVRLKEMHQWEEGISA